MWWSVCLAEYTYEKKNINLFAFKDCCRYFVLFSNQSNFWLMVHVDYLMITTILERCDLWQLWSNSVTPTNSKEPTVIIYRNRIDLYCKNTPLWTTSQVLRRPTVKTPRTDQWNENRWQWFGPPEGCKLKLQGHSDCLSLCMHVWVRACV